MSRSVKAAALFCALTAATTVAQAGDFTKPETLSGPKRFAAAIGEADKASTAFGERVLKAYGHGWVARVMSAVAADQSCSVVEQDIREDIQVKINGKPSVMKNALVATYTAEMCLDGGDIVIANNGRMTAESFYPVKGTRVFAVK